jgi:type II secretory pathway pseudopilin PulG
MKVTRHAGPFGFTLIEVVLSIGLLAFAILVIMAALGTAGRYAANDARRTLAVDLLHRSFHDLELAGAPGVRRSPLLGLTPIRWAPTPATIRLWFDADGNLVESQDRAFFRCELLATQDPRGALGHLHGRVVWPVRKTGDRPDGHVELFTSLLLP